MIESASKKGTKQMVLNGEIATEKAEEGTHQISGEDGGRTEKSEESSFHISKITIKNFKSISEISVELPRIGILTGPNNCGKSTILQAITLGFECLARNRNPTTGKIKKKGTVVHELSSVPVNHIENRWYKNKWYLIPIEIRIEFTNDTHFTSHVNKSYGTPNLNVVKYSDDLKDLDELARLIKSAPILIQGIPGLLRHATPLYSTIMSDALQSGQASQVLRNVLYSLKESKPSRFAIIEEAMSQHFGIELKEVEFDKKLDIEIRVPYAERENEFEIISAESGLHQILQLVTLLTWSGSSIILLDEPDAHLHTSLQRKIFTFLDDLSCKLDIQLLIATHSRDFLAAAPLDSIIPVDVTERGCRVKPMESMEHLLAEFERQGELSNLDIACLYNSKSCLFVEGPSDANILTALAERLGSDVFSGKNPAVIFPYYGKDRIKILPDLVDIFQKMIGTEIKWFVLRDRDALAPEIIKALCSKLENWKIANYHIWDRYHIENYLLDPRPITRIINSRVEKEAVEKDIEDLIGNCCRKVLDEMEPVINTENENGYREFIEPKEFQERGAELAVKYRKKAESSNDVLISIVSSKKVLGKLFQRIQEDYGVNIQTFDIIREMREEEINNEVIEFFKNLSNALR